MIVIFLAHRGRVQDLAVGGIDYDHLAAVASARASAGEWSVNRAWRELLIPDSWRIAICGQAEELAPALAERGLEAVIVSPAEVLS